MIKKRDILSMVAIALLFAACGAKKNTDPSNMYTKDEITKLENYPRLNGFKPHLIKVPKKQNEDDLKLQVIPGKVLDVDCNKHSLTGQIETKHLDTGETYYVFLTNGQIVRTLMNCPDMTKRPMFVAGPSTFEQYNSTKPLVIYTPVDMQVKYLVWQGGQTYDVSKTIDEAVQNEATKALEAFPKELNGYDRYVLLLAPLSEVQQKVKNRIIELIPGITHDVDCNHHWITGDFTTKEIDGWGYQYYIFDSDGNIASTRKACPDMQKHRTFVRGESKNIEYNSNLPVVVFVPKGKGFEVKYRVWETVNTMH